MDGSARPDRAPRAIDLSAVEIAMFHRFADKFGQIASFFRHTNTPLALTRDVLRLKRAGFVAEMKDGLRLRIKSHSGESFTLFENLIRRDYLTQIALKPGDTVVDIGANIGSFAILAASIVGPNGRVYAFEPMPETFERLRENVALNALENVECCRAAVDSESGTINLRVAKKSAFASAHDLNADKMTDDSVSAPCLTLERVFENYRIDRIHMLKVDCEGSEYGIFETLSPELAARIDQIAMEIHPINGKSVEVLKQNLQDLGFEVRPGQIWIAINRAARGNVT